VVAPIFFLDSSQAAAAEALIEIKNITSFITVGFEIEFFAINPSFARRVNFPSPARCQNRSDWAGMLFSIETTSWTNSVGL